MVEQGRQRTQSIVRVAPFVIAAFFVSLFLTYEALAAVPRYVNYQSRLKDSANNPVTTTLNIRFSIYNDVALGAPTGTPASDGPLLWSDVFSVTPDARGYFTVLLGSSSTFPSYMDFNTTTMYLGVMIGADAIEASPRVRFAAHPFALNSAAVNGYGAFGTATANSLLALDNSLNFNINTGAYMGASFQMSSTTATSSVLGHFTVNGNTQLATTSVSSLTASSVLINTGAGANTALLSLQNTDGDFQLFQTTANPEGVLSGSVGDLAVDIGNGNLFIKHEGNATSTGWTMILTDNNLASSTAFVLGGNSFGQTAELGTNDSYGLTIETVGLPAITIDTDQNVSISGDLVVYGTSTLATTTISDLTVTGATHGINLIDINGSSTIAYLVADNVFTGMNSFTTTTVASSTIVNLYTNEFFNDNGTSTNFYAANFVASTGTFDTVTVIGASNLQGGITNVLGDVYVNDNLVITGNATATQIYATTGTFDFLIVNNPITLDNITFRNATGTESLVMQGQTTLATTTIADLSVTGSSTLNLLSAVSGWFSNLVSAVNGWFTNLFADNATTTNLVAGTASVTSSLNVTGTTTLANTDATLLTLSEALVLASTTPASTVNALYNNGGALMWNGTQLAVVTTSASYTDLIWVNATGTGVTNLNTLIVQGVATMATTTATDLIVTGDSSLNNVSANNLTVTNNVTTTELIVTTAANVNQITVSNTTTLNGPTFLGDDLQFTVNGTNNIFFAGGQSHYMQWNNDLQQFIFSDGVNVIGTVSSTGLMVNGSATTTGNLYTSGYITASSGFRSNQYCDINGNNCFDPSISGWPTGGATGTMVTSIQKTTSTYNGNFSYAGKVGYQAANAICAAAYSGSHFCFTGEILQIISTQDISGFSDDAWAAEGPPGYTSNSNDCNGWTSSDMTKLGAYWQYVAAGGGMGWLVSCATNLPLSCCK